METVITFLTFIVLYFLTKYLIRKFQNHPPSPFLSLPIVGHLYLLKRPAHRSLAEISKRHGPVVLLQFGFRRVLIVSSPSAAEEIFTKNDRVFANRPRVLIGKHLGYNFTSLIWAPYGGHWRNLRRISSLELLSSSCLQMQSGLRVDEVTAMVRRLFHNQNQSADFKKEFFELTLNIMMRMITGKRYYGENVTEVEEAERFKKIRNLTFKLIALTNFGDYLPGFNKFGVLEKRLMECQGRINEFMQCLVEQHRRRIASDGSKDKTKNMIEVLLGLQEKEPEYYTDHIITGLMIALILAGTDTTGNTMEWAFSLVVNHPEELKKAQKEIDNKVGPDRLIDESDLAQLPHLHNIIKETLRLYPSFPLLLPHESSDECTLQGFRIPRGTTLIVNCWGIQNDPKIWEDPREFKPERFERMDGARDGFSLLAFGSGRRGCPGEGLAMRMVGLALGALIQCFDWNATGEEMVDMTEGIGYTLPRAGPLVVKFKPRPIMVKFLSQM